MHMICSKSAKILPIVAAACVIWSQPANAGASRWEETDGGRLRIVTEAWQPGMETLRGALQIELAPGWKTYWREPGSAGIPPQVSVSDEFVSGVEIHFPAPEWTTDAYGSWAGYKHPVSLPLTFSIGKDKSASVIDTDVFLGICKDVCVPISASLPVSLAATSGSSLQTMQVDAAFAALPGGNTPALTIEEPAWTSDGMLEIRVTHQGGGDETELFVAGGTAHAFRKPVSVSSDADTTVFDVEPLFDPAKTDAFELYVTARHGIDAVEIRAEIGAP